MTAERRNESEADEQYNTQRAPVEREMAEGDDGGETARNVATGAGIGVGMIVAIGFALLVVVLLGYIIVNAL